MTDPFYDPKNMTYGQITGKESINAMIYHCFDHICEEDKRKFVKKFRKQPDDSDQIMHTFRELVLGAYLSSRGFRVRHDYVIDSETPDWSILDDEEAVIGLVELTNFHIDKATENEIEEQLRAYGMAMYWRDQNKDNSERLYHSIWHKAQVYKSLIEELEVPYVVGVFGEFKAAVDLEEVRLCLFTEKTGLFNMYPQVSGVLYFFEDASDGYFFEYLQNPSALRVFHVASGVFSSETV